MAEIDDELKKQIHNFLCVNPLFEKLLERISFVEKYVKQQTHALEFALSPFVSKEQHEALRKELLQKIAQLEEQLSKVEKP